MKKHLLSLLLLLAVGVAFAQNITISGTVKDRAGEPIIGAVVRQVGSTTNASLADLEGGYKITAPIGSSISVDFLGYKPVQFKAEAGMANYNVVMEDEAVKGDEVVVIGYGGTSNRTTNTNAISKLDTKALERVSLSNAAAGLQGGIAGLQVANTSGKPGSEPRLVLRGGTTISGANNGALTVIDGIVRSLNDINPADIESIQVLKDAASTAIYGARASGGVILVKTKTGKVGAKSLSYSFKGGFNFARSGYDFVGAEDYLYYNRLGNLYASQNGVGRTLAQVNNQAGYGVNSAFVDVKYLAGNENLYAQGGWKTMTDPYDGTSQLMFKDYQNVMKDAAFNNPSFTQDHYLSFSGGNDKGTFLGSFGYYNEQGTVKSTSYERITGAINGSYKLWDNFKVFGGANIQMVNKPNLWINEAQLFYRSMSMWPTWNPYMEDGSPAAGVGSADGNPEYWSQKLYRRNDLRKTSANMGVDFDILPTLNLSANMMVYYIDNEQEEFDKAYTTQNNSNLNATRAAMAYSKREFQQQYNATLRYHETFGDKHNVDLMVGTEYMKYDVFTVRAKGKGAPIDDIPTLGSAAERTEVFSEKYANSILSFFGRFNYNYDQKYLLSVVVRADGISRLSDNRWGAFPGVSAAWNIHRESFYQDSKISKVISTIKPRLSYGVNGNVAGLGNYEVYGVYGGTADYNGNKGYLNTGLINSGLRWERSEAFEAGLDLGFFDNRLFVSMDYYNRTTKDLLTNINLPGYTGFSSTRTNLGSLQNQGFEFDARYQIFANQNGFSWDFSVNFATVANKILKLPENGNPNNRQGGIQVYDPKKGEVVWGGGLQEGQTFGEIYGFKQISIFRDWDDVKANANNRYDAIATLYGPAAWAALTDAERKSGGRKQIEPGDVNWADLNNDGVINNLDQVKIGNILPSFTGGFATNLSWKNISIGARFDFAVGHTLYNDLKARSLGQYQGAFGVIDEVKNSWSPSNTNTEIPKFYYADQLVKKNITRSNNATANLNSNNSSFYEKGDYLALREVTVSYSFPKKWINKLAMNKLDLYVTGQNLAYFTAYTGSNPEPIMYNTDGYGGVDQGRYPLPRTVIVGLSIVF